MIDFSSGNLYQGPTKVIQRKGYTSTGTANTQQEQLARDKEKQRALIYKTNYDDAKKSTDLKVDNSKILEKSHQDIMVKAMTDYNKMQGEALQRARSNNGEILEEDKQKLDNEMLALQTEYNNIIDSQTRLTKAKELAISDKEGIYDDEKIKNAEDRWASGQDKTFSYESFLKPVDTYTAVRKFSADKYGAQESIKNVTYKDSTGRVRTGSAKVDPRDEYQIKKTIEAAFLSNKRAIEGLKDEFNKAGIDVQMRYLRDRDNNKVIDEKDIDDNALLRFAYDQPELRDAAIGFVEDKKTTGADAEKGLVNATLNGMGVKMSPGIQVYGRTYGGKPYPVAYALTSPTIYGIPTAGATKLTGEYADKTDPGSVNGKLVLYDPLKHVFLVEATTASASSGTESKALLEIPEESIVGWETVPLKTEKGVIRADFWVKKEPQNITPTKEQGVDIGL